MKTYNVIVEEEAQNDLTQLVRYIYDNFNEPQTAKKIYTEIKEKIISLENMPSRHPVTEEEPYKAAEIRLLYIKNYTVFYKISDDCVRVLRVLYSRRDWKNIL